MSNYLVDGELIYLKPHILKINSRDIKIYFQLSQLKKISESLIDAISIATQIPDSSIVLLDEEISTIVTTYPDITYVVSKNSKPPVEIKEFKGVMILDRQSFYKKIEQYLPRVNFFKLLRLITKDRKKFSANDKIDVLILSHYLTTSVTAAITSIVTVIINLYSQDRIQIRDSLSAAYTFVVKNISSFTIYVFCLGAAVGAFYLRKNFRTTYGILEFTSGLIGLGLYLPETTNGTGVFKMLTAIYILVRGMDNIDVGLPNSPLYQFIAKKAE